MKKDLNKENNWLDFPVIVQDYKELEFIKFIDKYKGTKTPIIVNL